MVRQHEHRSECRGTCCSAEIHLLSLISREAHDRKGFGGSVQGAGDGQDASDYVKVANILFVYRIIFCLDQKRVVDPWVWVLVEDAERWNSFPWGAYSYQMLIILPCKREAIGGKGQGTYHFYGPIWALQIWACEVIPDLAREIVMGSVVCTISREDDDSIFQEHAAAGRCTERAICSHSIDEQEEVAGKCSILLFQFSSGCCGAISPRHYISSDTAEGLTFEPGIEGRFDPGIEGPARPRLYPCEQTGNLLAHNRRALRLSAALDVMNP
ncbi:hypothetical protein C2S52_015871 [Perilla frutescens var. hirtella]|nr:hypothetical protein C2S52_015871 [Perilla frutescens var. hirtella]